MMCPQADRERANERVVHGHLLVERNIFASGSKERLGERSPVLEEGGKGRVDLTLGAWDWYAWDPKGGVHRGDEKKDI